MMIPRCSHLIDSMGLRRIQKKSCDRCFGFFVDTVRCTKEKKDLIIKETCFESFQIATESLSSHAEIQRQGNVTFYTFNTVDYILYVFITAFFILLC